MSMTDETLNLVKAAHSAPLSKAYTQALGLVNYNLEAPAKSLVPVLTPLRNMIVRSVSKNGGTAVHWRAITGFNTDLLDPGVEEGKRNGSLTTTLTNWTASYKTIGFEDYVTFQADWAAESFDDAKARATRNLLWATMIAEENIDLGGNATLVLSQPTAPTGADVTTGGAIPQSTNVVISVIALTHWGWQKSSVVNGVNLSASRTNMDGTTTTVAGGHSLISSATTVTTATDGLSTHSVTAYTPVVKGAVAYAWYWGATSGAAQKLGAITTINTVLITVAQGTGTQAANNASLTSDSVNAYQYDGLLYQIWGVGQQDSSSDSGAYVKNMDTVAGTGKGLTADGAGGIEEIDEALQYFWDNRRLSPDMILCNSQEAKNITAKVIGGGGAPVFRFNLDGAGESRDVTAGGILTNYINKFAPDGGKGIKIMIHPNMPAGTIMFYTKQVPYPLPNVGNLIEKDLRRDYYQIEWPLRTLRYEYGLYFDGVLKCYFPPAFGVITNIANL